MACRFTHLAARLAGERAWSRRTDHSYERSVQAPIAPFLTRCNVLRHVLLPIIIMATLTDSGPSDCDDNLPHSYSPPSLKKMQIMNSKIVLVYVAIPSPAVPPALRLSSSALASTPGRHRHPLSCRWGSRAVAAIYRSGRQPLLSAPPPYHQ